MKVYFDTNVYDFLAKSSGGSELRLYLKRNGVYVEMSMDVLHEVARIKDETVKSRSFETIRMIASSYSRFPEGYLEAQEVIRELQRCRPEWVRTHPDLKTVNRFLGNHRLILSAFRRTGTLEANESLSEYVSLVERAINRGNPQVKKVRAALLKSVGHEVQTDNPRLQKCLEPLPNPERHWRLKASTSWRRALNGEPSMRDWRDWTVPYFKAVTE